MSSHTLSTPSPCHIEPEPLPTLPPLFAYGALMYEPVLDALLDRPAAAPVGRTVGALDGWQTRVGPHGDHPLLLAVHTADRTPGVLLTGLSAAEWELLDAFADPACDLRSVLPITALGPVPALAFVLHGSAELSPRYRRMWDQREYERGLPERVAAVATWRAGLNITGPSSRLRRARRRHR